MKYTKPDVVQVGSAVGVIESGLEKVDCFNDTNIPSDTCAYEADE